LAGAAAPFEPRKRCVLLVATTFAHSRIKVALVRLLALSEHNRIAATRHGAVSPARADEDAADVTTQKAKRSASFYSRCYQSERDSQN
jgi:hypothetical protein